MSNEKGVPEEAQQVNRLFEQPPDAVSFYSDLAQVISTGKEVILQLYESIPGPPSPPKGQVSHVRTRLRATITLSTTTARNLGTMLLQRISEDIKK